MSCSTHPFAIKREAIDWPSTAPSHSDTRTRVEPPGRTVAAVKTEKSADATATASLVPQQPTACTHAGDEDHTARPVKRQRSSPDEAASKDAVGAVQAAGAPRLTGCSTRDEIVCKLLRGSKAKGKKSQPCITVKGWQAIFINYFRTPFDTIAGEHPVEVALLTRALGSDTPARSSFGFLTRAHIEKLVPFIAQAQATDATTGKQRYLFSDNLLSKLSRSDAAGRKPALHGSFTADWGAYLGLGRPAATAAVPSDPPTVVGKDGLHAVFAALPRDAFNSFDRVLEEIVASPCPNDPGWPSEQAELDLLLLDGLDLI